MKRILLIISITSFFVGCKNKDETTVPNNKVVLVDSNKVQPEKVRAVPVVAESRNNAPAPVVTTTETTKKKGWSSRAKGAVIGGATGAVGGAIISKHKGTGAVVGGVVGAAGGYIIGNEKDKKNKR